MWQLGLFRLLAGIGIGGEWALAGTYVAEAWPEDRRKMGAGYLQTGYYAGFFLASALNYTVAPHYGWRAMFWCGLTPVIVAFMTLEDAVNLGWKLAAVLAKWGEPPLLDSYTAERRPIFVETGQAITDGIANDRAFLARFSPERDRGKPSSRGTASPRETPRRPPTEPHYEGSPIVWGPVGSAISVHGQHTFQARPGHHLAPVALSSGRNVFEQMGPGYTLISLTGHPRPAARFQAAARALRIPLRVLADTFAGPRTAYGCRFILVRPDQYVAWTGDDLPIDSTPH